MNLKVAGGLGAALLVVIIAVAAMIFLWGNDKKITGEVRLVEDDIVTSSENSSDSNTDSGNESNAEGMEGWIIAAAQREYVYTGNEIKPEVTVTLNDKPVSSENYKVQYSNNVEIGNGTVTILGQNGYEGDRSIGFKIVPAAPEMRDFTDYTGQSIYINWSDVPDVTGYIIFRKSNKDSDFSQLDKTTNSSTYYVDDSLDETLDYTYKVQAYITIDNDEFVSDYSKENTQKGRAKAESSSSESEKDEDAEPSADSKKIEVANILQEPELPTGCEVTALTMLLNYYGYSADKVTMSDTYLPKEDFREENGVTIGADIVTTFAGNPRYNESEGYFSYGCYAPCIVTTANSYFSAVGSADSATNLTGKSFNYLLSNYIDNDEPVLIWVTSNGLHEIEAGSTWQTSGGTTINWKKYEHCVVLTGYDKKTKQIYVSDSLAGNTSYDADLIETRYNEMGQQAVAISN